MLLLYNIIKKFWNSNRKDFRNNQEQIENNFTSDYSFNAFIFKMLQNIKQQKTNKVRLQNILSIFPFSLYSIKNMIS